MQQDTPQIISLKRHLNSAGIVAFRNFSITNLLYRFILYFVDSAKDGLTQDQCGYLMHINANTPVNDLYEPKMVMWIVDENYMAKTKYTDLYRKLTDCGLYLQKRLDPFNIDEHVEKKYGYINKDWPGAMYVIKAVTLTQEDEHIRLLNKWKDVTLFDLVRARPQLREQLFNYALYQTWK